MINDDFLSNGSILGNWSESDKQKFRTDMEGVKELSSYGEYKTAWIECYLEKCEASFNSYYMANNYYEVCRKLALECENEVIPK